nr:FCD domain-containing protein [Microvirga puerhi]
MRSDGKTGTSLAETAFREIEKMIVSGDLEAGSHVNENAIAERLGISRGPVREACRRLEEAGIIELIPNRGAFVRIHDIQDILDIYDMKAVLQAHAGRMLAQTITNQQLAQLESLLEEAQAAADRDEVGEFLARNGRFHSLAMEFTGNRRLLIIHESMEREIQVWRRKLVSRAFNISAVANEHLQMLKALQSGNPGHASEIFRDHCIAGRSRILRMLDAIGNSSDDALSATSKLRIVI